MEGAYSVRYEILKKRIDKAHIKGSKDRITKPDHVTIVYSQETERLSYLEDINFLISKRILEKEIEEHRVEDLQGIAGLMILRCKVA